MMEIQNMLQTFYEDLTYFTIVRNHIFKLLRIIKKNTQRHTSRADRVLDTGTETSRLFLLYGKTFLQSANISSVNKTAIWRR